MIDGTGCGGGCILSVIIGVLLATSLTLLHGWVEHVYVYLQVTQECHFKLNVFQSCLPHTDCEDGEIVCPLGRIGSSERIDTFGRSRRCINESFVCDGVLDCVGGTDEVDCGPSKILHCHESNSCHVWKAVGDVFVAVPGKKTCCIF